MKINELFGKKFADVIQPGNNKSSSSQLFDDILRQEVERGGQAAQTSEISGTRNEVTPISAELRLKGLELTENTLSTLATYSRALENIQHKASDLEPFIAALELETASLLEVKSQLDQNDPLAKLLDQVSTVSYVETVKYRRGDYTA